MAKKDFSRIVPLIFENKKIIKEESYDSKTIPKKIPKIYPHK